ANWTGSLIQAMKCPMQNSVVDFEALVRENAPTFAKRESGKPFRKTPQCNRLRSNPDIPVIGSQVQHEISALDNAATEMAYINVFLLLRLRHREREFVLSPQSSFIYDRNIQQGLGTLSVSEPHSGDRGADSLWYSRFAINRGNWDQVYNRYEKNTDNTDSCSLQQQNLRHTLLGYGPRQSKIDYAPNPMVVRRRGGGVSKLPALLISSYKTKKSGLDPHDSSEAFGCFLLTASHTATKVHPTEIRTSYLPILGSLALREASALANYATEAIMSDIE
ncbi:unnamed protein product, partial [Timema podura]|nr:unnamed protein product [Timema podura]